MRRTQSLKLSIANYSKTSAFCGHYSAKIRTANLRLRAFFRGKGRPLLYPILPPRGKISRGNISETGYLPVLSSSDISEEIGQSDLRLHCSKISLPGDSVCGDHCKVRCQAGLRGRRKHGNLPVQPLVIFPCYQIGLLGEFDLAHIHYAISTLDQKVYLRPSWTVCIWRVTPCKDMR